MSVSATHNVRARRGRSAALPRLFVAALLLGATGSASAAQIVYTSIQGIWHDPMDNVAGVQPGDPVITNGNPTSIIRWGTTSGTPQSGYDFTVALPPPQTLPGPAPVFSLGTFTHRNYEVGDPSLTQVQLDIVVMLSVDGVPTGPLTFTYTFHHEETPNNAVPCPYPTPPGEGCTDRVTIVASPQPTVFNVGGVDYTLSLGFLSNGVPVSEFITREGGTINTSGLGGQFTIAPRLYPEKSAALQVDAMSPGIVDAGDVLRYTIQIHNNSTMVITHALLRDAVPANTTYVADSMTLNGQPVGRPDGGVSPLVAGIDVSSSDLTPPLPGPGGGTLTPGQMAVVQYDLRVNDGTPPGTVIANQATVTTTELPPALTDGDGNPANGPEPTVVVVGDLQQLKITKLVAVVGGGPAIAGATLEYTVVAQNIGIVPAYKVLLRDDISVPNPGYLTFVNGSYTMNGATDGITVVDPLLTADYSTTYGALQPGRSVTLKFRALLNANLAVGTRVTNTAMVYWNDPQQTASASVSIDIGGTPGSAMLNGRVWYDVNFDTVADAAELKLEGWVVEMYRNDTLTYSARTNADGVYRLSGVEPNYNTTDKYELRFRRPGAGPNTAMLGRARSDFTNGLQRITDVVVMSGANLQNVDLPINPNGVVYDSISRAALAGATLTLVRSGGGSIPSTCFYDPVQQGQVTLGDGFYKFDLNFSSPSCPNGGSYLIQVAPPSAAYLPGESQMIPALSGAATAAFSVPSCATTPDDAVPATTQYCESAPSGFAPPSSVLARSAGTNYRLNFIFDNSFVPGTSQIFNNHIPLDLNLDQSVTISKTTPTVNVSRGQLVPYVITVANGIGVNLNDVSVVDRFPAGFRYVDGSARLDGVPAEPSVSGRELVWRGLSVTADGRHTLKLLLAVGSGVGEGEFVNRAQAMSTLTGRALSNEASATVRIVPNADFDCTDVFGKVFDDANRNGIQDNGERGIPGVRLATARGLLAVTDQQGRFHITCAVTPRDGRGSNFVVKLDDRTLPSGFRASTNALQVKRATRGKALEFSFGASIHRVVGLDISDPVFEPNTAEMRDLWRPRVDLLIAELRKGPAVLRLSYLADLEDPRLVQHRLDVVKKQIMDAWRAPADCCSYELSVETEVFWRRGGPPDASERHAREAGDAHE
jgi:uncharacterized repeat protein (TIGR01451 family)